MQAGYWKKGSNLLNHGKKTFWAPSKDFEEKAEASTTSTLKEDHKWMEALKQQKGKPTIGAKDIRTSKKIKKKSDTIKIRENKQKPVQGENREIQWSSGESSCEDGQLDPDFTINMPATSGKKKK